MSHWTQDPKIVKHFEEKASKQGYTLDEALTALGIEAITDLRGSIGEALNRLAQIKKQNSNRPTSVMPNDSLKLVPIAGTLSNIYGNPEQLRAIAHRARRFFSWATIKGKPSDLDDVQVLAAIQYAHIIGANPANEIHPWYDPSNNVFILMPHYSYNIRKAREIDPRLMFWCKDMCADDPSLVEGDIGVTCHVRTEAQQDMLKALLKADVPYEIAHEQTCFSAVGIVSARDRKKAKNPPRGWTWKQRAETRAISNALKRAFGTLAIADHARSQFQALGMPDDGELYLDSVGIEELAAGQIIDVKPSPVELDSDVEEGVIEDEEQPIEPEPTVTAGTEEKQEHVESEEPLQPERKKRSWGADPVQILITNDIASNPKHAVTILNMSDLDPQDELDVILRWGEIYREARVTKAHTDEAAGMANAWLAGTLTLIQEGGDQQDE